MANNIDMHNEKFIHDLLRYWEQDTMHLSVHDLNHPVFAIIERISSYHKDMVITSILHYIQKYSSWAFIIFQKLIDPENFPVYPEDIKGRLDSLRGMWIKWGKENGYSVYGYIV